MLIGAWGGVGGAMRLRSLASASALHKRVVYGCTSRTFQLKKEDVWIDFPLPTVRSEFAKGPLFFCTGSVKLWNEMPRGLRGRKPLRSWELTCARGPSLSAEAWPLPLYRVAVSSRKILTCFPKYLCIIPENSLGEANVSFIFLYLYNVRFC